MALKLPISWEICSKWSTNPSSKNSSIKKISKRQFLSLRSTWFNKEWQSSNVQSTCLSEAIPDHPHQSYCNLLPGELNMFKEEPWTLTSQQLHNFNTTVLSLLSLSLSLQHINQAKKSIKVDSRPWRTQSLLLEEIQFILQKLYEIPELHINQASMYRLCKWNWWEDSSILPGRTQGPH